jgi:hypothetical protein
MSRFDLESETPPPPHLKERLLATLRARQLIEPARPSRSFAWPLIAAAACLVVGFAGGFAVRGSPVSEGSAPRYLLLLYEDSTYQDAARPAERAAEYSAWARSLAAEGRAISGDELAVDSQVVASPPATSRIALGTLGGFFLIGAANEADAVAVARNSPHVKYGGTIVVRPIMTR